MRLALFPLLLVLLVSCGGKSGSAGDAGNDAGAALCESFDDEEGYQVAVRISNQTPGTIHVGSELSNCGAPPLFEVADDQGTTLSPLAACRLPCEMLRTTVASGCPTICAFPSAITLAPGDSTTTSWSGLFGTQTELPQSCMPKSRQNDSRQCDQARQIEPGSYTFSARAGTSLDCSKTTGGPCNACMPSGAGGCSSPATIAGDILTAEATVDVGASLGVDIVFK